MSVPRFLKAFRHASRVPEVWRCVRQTPDWRTLIAGYLGLGPVRYPVVFRDRSGDALILKTYHDLVTVWILFCRGEYRIDPGCRTIFDVGANIGAFSVLAARVAPESRIIALEPFPDTRARLEAHVAANGLGDRVTCRPWAVGGADEVRTIDLSAPVPSQSRGLNPGDHAGPGEPVEVITLRTMLERSGVGRADMLKMDIEGAEHEAIIAAPPEVLRRFGTIALEYHPNGPKAKLFRHLTDAGFALQYDFAPHADNGVAAFRRLGDG